VSIWASTVTVGRDVFGSEAPDGVIGYAEGWSNHYPDRVVEKPACVDLAEIPAWCVPGHRDDYSDTATGTWVRMSVNVWNDQYGRPMCATGATVNLDPEAARALGKALIEWADSEHVEPTEDAP